MADIDDMRVELRATRLLLVALISKLRSSGVRAELRLDDANVQSIVGMAQDRATAAVREQWMSLKEARTVQDAIEQIMSEFRKRP